MSRYPAGPDKARHLDLDTRGLTIESVTAGGRPLAFMLEPAVPNLGQRLRITLPAPPPAKVAIRYRTSPDATALQWLGPRQTTSGRMPFLFTQSQAIHARSWIPIVDSPGVRVTYDAVIHAPKGMQVVMSAEHGKHDTAAGVFRFRMPHADPALPDRAGRRRAGVPRRCPIAPASTPSPRSSSARPRSSPTSRRWCRSRRSSTGRTPGAAGTPSSCPRASPSAGWRTRASPSPPRPSSPATRAWSACSPTSWPIRGPATSSPTRPGPTSG